MNKANYTPLVPYMPEDPQLFHSYVPYQLDTEEFGLSEALSKGSLFTALFSPFAGEVGPNERLC